MDNLYLAAPIPESPYDRIEIIFYDTKLTARPIEFDYDEGGMPRSAIKYETTNPVTGQMVHFSINDIMSQPGAPLIITTIEKFQKSRKSCPFIDPIEAGVYKIDQL